MKKIISILILAWGVLSNIYSQSPVVTRDTLLMQDSAFVIITACSPICSSVARVYAIDNKEWQLVRVVASPDEHMTFPEAYFENGKIRWRDNTAMLLDEEGK